MHQPQSVFYTPIPGWLAMFAFLSGMIVAALLVAWRFLRLGGYHANTGKD